MRRDSPRASVAFSIMYSFRLCWRIGVWVHAQGQIPSHWYGWYRVFLAHWTNTHISAWTWVLLSFFFFFLVDMSSWDISCRISVCLVIVMLIGFVLVVSYVAMWFKWTSLEAQFHHAPQERVSGLALYQPPNQRTEPSQD
jgi:hypothetical protein